MSLPRPSSVGPTIRDGRDLSQSMRTVTDVRAEVVGSLLRPQYLALARQQLEAGELAPSDYKAVEDRAVDEAIELQTSAGIDVITDGEQRRYAFYGHLVDSVSGFDKLGGWAIPFRDEKGGQLELKQPVVAGQLRPLPTLHPSQLTYLRDTAHSPTKRTLISAQHAAAYYDPAKSN